MSTLFLELYLDEDVDVLLSDLIRARGFAATTTREAGNLHADDSNQLLYAVQHQKTFLTHNRVDFETLATTYFREQKTHYGIIIATRHPPHEIARRLLIILNQVTADEMINQLVYI
jgi:predicted nuclease of predicted toxin-antitoxin system